MRIAIAAISLFFSLTARADILPTCAFGDQETFETIANQANAKKLIQLWDICQDDADNLAKDMLAFGSGTCREDERVCMKFYLHKAYLHAKIMGRMHFVEVRYRKVQSDFPDTQK